MVSGTTSRFADRGLPNSRRCVVVAKNRSVVDAGIAASTVIAKVVFLGASHWCYSTTLRCRRRRPRLLRDPVLSDCLRDAIYCVFRCLHPRTDRRHGTTAHDRTTKPGRRLSVLEPTSRMIPTQSQPHQRKPNRSGSSVGFALQKKLTNPTLPSIPRPRDRYWVR